MRYLSPVFTSSPSIALVLGYPVVSTVLPSSSLNDIVGYDGPSSSSLLSSASSMSASSCSADSPVYVASIVSS